MNGKQYNNVIDYTVKHEQTEDSLATARAVFNNMGVALPQGDLPQVAETLKSNDYMGWRACTMQEAQEAANNGTAAIGVSDERIVVLTATDEEQPVTETAAVMTLSENTSAYAVADLAYYSYVYDTTMPLNRSWEYYANRIVSYANSFNGMTESQIEAETGFSLSNGLWCVDFVRLCCKLAGVYDTNYTEIIPTTSSSTDMRNKFRNLYPGTLHEGVNGIQPGDIAFVAASSSSVNPYHTCIALSGLNSQNKVNTINGNWGNEGDERVRTQYMPVSGCVIKWYAHPDYEKANER